MALASDLPAIEQALVDWGLPELPRKLILDFLPLISIAQVHYPDGTFVERAMTTYRGREYGTFIQQRRRVCNGTTFELQFGIIAPADHLHIYYQYEQGPQSLCVSESHTSVSHTLMRQIADNVFLDELSSSSSPLHEKHIIVKELMRKCAAICSICKRMTTVAR